jgi:hypothetical protein
MVQQEILATTNLSELSSPHGRRVSVRHLDVSTQGAGIITGIYCRAIVNKKYPSPFTIINHQHDSKRISPVLIITPRKIRV